MAHIETSRQLPVGAITTYRLVSFCDEAIKNAKATRATYATSRALNKLSDSQLADIGLCRADIKSAARIAATNNF